MSLPVLLQSAATSHEAHMLLGLLRCTQSSHSSPRLSECKKKQGRGDTATASAARHDLSAKSSTSTADLLLPGEFHNGSHRKKSIPDTPEAATSPQNILPKGFRAFLSYFCTNRATTLGAGGCRWIPWAGRQGGGQGTSSTQEAAALQPGDRGTHQAEV